MNWVDISVVGTIILMIGLVVFGVVYSVNKDAEKRDAACTKMWALARTNSDSINIIRQCEYPKQQEVIPVFIPMPTGGR